MPSFGELLEKSVIVTALTTGALTLTLCYLWATGAVVPDDLQNLTLVVFGYWFGSQAAKNAYRG